MRGGLRTCRMRPFFVACAGRSPPLCRIAKLFASRPTLFGGEAPKLSGIPPTTWGASLQPEAGSPPPFYVIYSVQGTTLTLLQTWKR